MFNALSTILYFQLVGSFWMGGCGRPGCSRHLALQSSQASYRLGEDPQLHTGSYQRRNN